MHDMMVGKYVSLHGSYRLWYGHVCNVCNRLGLLFMDSLTWWVRFSMPCLRRFFYVQQGESGVWRRPGYPAWSVVSRANTRWERKMLGLIAEIALSFVTNSNWVWNCLDFLLIVLLFFSSFDACCSQKCFTDLFGKQGVTNVKIMYQKKGIHLRIT